MRNLVVSVIIPAYNHEKYVQDTIKSILNQTYKNIELIVVDDGSKDSTFLKIQEMREECEKRFSRVHFETKENEGTCRTLNKLLDLSQGEYVYLIASDDMAKPQAIEKQLAFLRENPGYALCVGDNEIIDSDSNRAYWDKNHNLVYHEKEADYLSFADSLKRSKKGLDFNSEKFGNYESLCRQNYIPNGYLIRKSIFEKIGYFTPEAPLEDWWLMLQISKYAKLKYLDEILFSYRWHGANTMAQSQKIQAMREKTKHYEEKILSGIDENKVLPEVLAVKRRGALYKFFGIPFVFEIKSYEKGFSKIKIVRLFGIKILQYAKGI